MKNNKLNDYIAKLPYNHPYNKPELKEVKVIISNNNVVQNTKLLVPLINTSISITGQYPKLIKTKKSVASFKLRKGGVVGLLTTLRGGKCENFLSMLNIYGLPRLVTNQPNLVKNQLAQTIRGPASQGTSSPLWGATREGAPRRGGDPKGGNSILTLGLNNITVFSYLAPLREESLQVSHNINIVSPAKLTGGYTQISQTFKPAKKLLNSPRGHASPAGPISVPPLGGGPLGGPVGTTNGDITLNLHKFFYSQLYIPISL